MSSLLDALDLAGFTRCHGFETRRPLFGYVSQFLRKSSGSRDDEFYARNLWPCRDPQCAAVLGPMDSADLEPRTISEMYAEDERCCPVCGTYRHKVDFFEIIG